MTTLVIFMGIDYVTGLIVAGVFHNSGKTESGALESRAGWMPAYSGTSVSSYNFNLSVAVGNSESVIIEVDPSGMATQADILNLQNQINKKVTVIDGKYLSTNDFTDEYKLKLEGIEEGATNTTPYILPTASSDTKGVIKVGYSQSGRYYPVRLDSNDRAYVYVPWESGSSDTYVEYGLSISGHTISLVEGGSNKSVTVPDETGTGTSYGLSISGHTISLVEGGSNKSVTVPDETGTYPSYPDLDGIRFLPQGDTQNETVINVWNEMGGNLSIDAPVYALSFDTMSSLKYKTNIIDMPDEVAQEILALRPVVFDYKDDKYDKNCKGLIAEEAYKVDAYQVSLKNNEPDSIDYSRYVAQLIKIVQLQNDRINELEQKVAALTTL